MQERDLLLMAADAMTATNHADALCDCSMCRAAWTVLKKLKQLTNAAAAVDAAHTRFVKAREIHNAKQSLNPPSAATMRSINAGGTVDQDLHWCSNDPLPG